MKSLEFWKYLLATMLLTVWQSAIAEKNVQNSNFSDKPEWCNVIFDSIPEDSPLNEAVKILESKISWLDLFRWTSWNEYITREVDNSPKSDTSVSLEELYFENKINTVKIKKIKNKINILVKKISEWIFYFNKSNNSNYLLENVKTWGDTYNFSDNKTFDFLIKKSDFYSKEFWKMKYCSYWLVNYYDKKNSIIELKHRLDCELISLKFYETSIEISDILIKLEESNKKCWIKLIWSALWNGISYSWNNSVQRNVTMAHEIWHKLTLNHINDELEKAEIILKYWCNYSDSHLKNICWDNLMCTTYFWQKQFSLTKEQIKQALDFQKMCLE